MDKLSVFLKMLRLRNGDERLSDMAKKLGVSASYLSTVENEKRNMTDKLFQKIIKIYQLNTEEAEQLSVLRQLASKNINVAMDDLDDEKKKTVVKFLSSLDSLSEEEMEKINLLLNKKK
mgnify:CR=1 FL=1